MKKNQVEICPNCHARIVHADYAAHKDGSRGRQIKHFCGYGGLPTVIDRKKFKKMREFDG